MSYSNTVVCAAACSVREIIINPNAVFRNDIVRKTLVNLSQNTDNYDLELITYVTCVNLSKHATTTTRHFCLKSLKALGVGRIVENIDKLFLLPLPLEKYGSHTYKLI